MQHPSIPEMSGSNRTFMELKYMNQAKIVNTAVGSNRTFMELKLRWDIGTRRKAGGSNRTFMELKSRHDDASVVHL